MLSAIKKTFRKRICAIFNYFQERRIEIPSNGLMQPHICACLKSAPGFLTSYVMFFFVLSELSCEVIAGSLILVELLTITV
jgi:hypothetical protein